MRIAGFVFVLLLLSSCVEQESESLFQEIPTAQSKVYFNNEIEDTPTFNILDYLYFYNGGGVATGDLNNDGLPDIFFTSNLGEDKLYFNKGDFNFEEVSDRFEKNQLGGWSTGVTLADVNSDGWLDIYVCKLGNCGPYKSHNKLFINKEGKRFVESAKEYGLDFSGFGTQAAFFDYDQDGDLDCYLLNHSVKSPEQFRPSAIREQKDSLAGDLMLELVNGKYVDVTAAAGIYSSSVGFGLGIDVADVNNDGWLDIYVGNDFHENDYLYLNQKDKTFKEVITKATGHTSNFSMGCTIADLNNDLRPDILSLDMKPEDETVYKKSGGWETIEIYNYKRKFGYHHQSPRNALQINIGWKGEVPQYSEQAAFYGLEATDWSWSPLIFDFDNDGDKDVFITNGIVRRPNDMDFVNFDFDSKDPDKINQVQQMPSGKAANCFFENDLEAKAFLRKEFLTKNVSTGAAVADFNQDGLLDIVINNINAPATILKNNGAPASENYLRIKLEDQDQNPFGLGATIYLYQKEKTQWNVIKSSSGFQSFSEPIAHFGLGNTSVDSLKIIWPDGFIQIEMVKELNKTYSFKKKSKNKGLVATTRRSRSLKKITDYKHRRNDFNDQQAHKWLLYNQSNLGPKMTDFNQELIFLTGNRNSPSGWISTTEDIFIPRKNQSSDGNENNACVINNGKEEIPFLFIAKSSGLGKAKTKDRLYEINDTDVFSITELSMPWKATNSAVSLSCDYDQDGDDDVFVGVNSNSGEYGTADSSFLLINNKEGFLEKKLSLAGMIYDAAWEDLDGNGFPDLIVAGHWMPITIFYNSGDQLEKKELSNTSGLWFSLSIDDVNGDGLKDILAGNFGTNHSLKASVAEPMRFYQNDFDKNGQVETLVTYVKEGREVPYPNQGLFAAQIPGIKKKYLKNTDYAAAKINELLRPKLLESAIKKELVTFQSTCFFQRENGQWQSKPLPAALQVAPVFDVEKKEEQAYFFGGNFFEVDPNWGRQDASCLTAFQYQKDHWVEMSQAWRLPIVTGAIRDLLYKDEKLYIAINDDYLKVLDFTN